MGGSFTEDEFRTIRTMIESLISFPSVCIETGSYHGDSTHVFRNNFDKVFTIEINKKLFHHVSERFQSDENVCCLYGDSSSIMKRILALYPPETHVFYFLDAHQSGHDTSNNGNAHVPLREELSVISSFITSQSVIVIDDVRLFDRYWDWKDITIENILSWIKHPVRVWFISNDRLFILFS